MSLEKYKEDENTEDRKIFQQLLPLRIRTQFALQGCNCSIDHTFWTIFVIAHYQTVPFMVQDTEKVLIHKHGTQKENGKMSHTQQSIS